MSNKPKTKEFTLSQEVTTIQKIKEHIKLANQKTILYANREIILLYWQIGKILDEHGKWGNRFIDRISLEIRKEFPSLKGFSVRNLKNMLRFYREYPNYTFVQSVIAQIPWTHNIELFRVKSFEERKWYIEKIIENG